MINASFGIVSICLLYTSDDAVEQGATAKTELKREGNLIYPAVFDHVTTDMRLAWEEPFGPVSVSYTHLPNSRGYWCTSDRRVA